MHDIPQLYENRLSYFDHCLCAVIKAQVRLLHIEVSKASQLMLYRHCTTMTAVRVCTEKLATCRRS